MCAQGETRQYHINTESGDVRNMSQEEKDALAARKGVSPDQFEEEYDDLRPRIGDILSDPESEYQPSRSQSVEHLSPSPVRVRKRPRKKKKPSAVCADEPPPAQCIKPEPFAAPPLVRQVVDLTGRNESQTFNPLTWMKHEDRAGPPLSDDPASIVPVICMKGAHKAHLKMTTKGRRRWDENSIAPKNMYPFRNEMPADKNISVLIFDAYQRCWRTTLKLGENMTRESSRYRFKGGLSTPFHTMVESVRFGDVLNFMLQRWPDDILLVAQDYTDKAKEFAEAMRTMDLGNYKPNVRAYIEANGVFPGKNANTTVNYATGFWAQTKQKGGGKTHTSLNSFEYYIDALCVLSPLDILFLQDQVGESQNWFVHFGKFVRLRMFEELNFTEEGKRKRLDQENRYASFHYELPWLFCLNHMTVEGVVKATDRSVIPRMMEEVAKMRAYMVTRTRGGDFSLPTYQAYGDSKFLLIQERRDRFAQFCWFLASTIGNTALPCAGAWLPYCAHNRGDTSRDYGLEMSDAEFQRLDTLFRTESFQQVRERLTRANHWVGATLSHMDALPGWDEETVDYGEQENVGGEEAQRRANESFRRTPHIRRHFGYEGSPVLEPEPPRSPPPSPGLSPIPPADAWQVGDTVQGNWMKEGEWFSSRVTKVWGDGTYDLLYDDGYSETRVGPDRIRPGARKSPSPESPSPPREQLDDDFASAPGPNIDPPVAEPTSAHVLEWGVNDDFYSAEPPKKRPRTAEFRELSRSPVRQPQAPELVEVHLDLDAPPPEVEQPSPAEPPAATEEFNYIPYIVFGGVLLLLAVITDDPRGSNL